MTKTRRRRSRKGNLPDTVLGAKLMVVFGDNEWLLYQLPSTGDWIKLKLVAIKRFRYPTWSLDWYTKEKRFMKGITRKSKFDMLREAHPALATILHGYLSKHPTLNGDQSPRQQQANIPGGG